MVPADDGDEDVARSFALRFLEGAFADAVELFSDDGRDAMVSSYFEGLGDDSTTAEDALEAYWWGLHGLYGDPGGVDSVTRSGGDVCVGFSFEDGAETAHLSVTAGEITDCWFEPAYEVPDYVDEDAFTERSVTVDARDVALGARLAVPEGSGPFPGVVLVHGAGIHDPDGTVGASKLLKDIAWGLATEGIATLRYEKRLAEHEVADEDFTLDTVVVDDAIAALNTLSDVDEVAGDSVFVAGHSQGGLAAPRIAERHGALAGVVVLDGRADTVLDPDNVDFIRYEYEVDGELDHEQERELEAARETIRRIADGDFEDDETLGGKPGVWHRSRLDYDPSGTASDLDVPSFVLKGGRADEDVQPELVAWLRDEYETWRAVDLPAGSRVEFYDDLDHYLQEGYAPAHPSSIELGGNVSPAVVTDLTEWIHDVA